MRQQPSLSTLIILSLILLGSPVLLYRVFEARTFLEPVPALGLLFSLSVSIGSLWYVSKAAITGPSITLGILAVATLVLAILTIWRIYA